MQEGFKKVITEKISLFMTLFNVGFDSVYSMSIEKLNAVLNWRIQYEEAKRKSIDEEISKQKSHVSKSSKSNKLKDTYK